MRSFSRDYDCVCQWGAAKFDPTALGWLSCGFTSTRHKTGHFGDVSPSQSLGLVWKKLNLTQQKHAFTNQKKCSATQNKRMPWSVDRCKWRKVIKEVRWPGWVWAGERFFWYRPTRVVLDKRPLNGGCCCHTMYTCYAATEKLVWIWFRCEHQCHKANQMQDQSINHDL